jgi:general secretion pathway protein A
MVLDFYKLREQPFGVTPDSRYLYLSDTHKEALASLLYGVGAGRGFVALIAKPGMGKTTLLFRGLSQLQGKAKTVFLFQTISTPLDFLRALLTDLGVGEVQGSLIEMQSKLNDVLVEQSRSGERFVVMVDEAQNRDESVLELVRMLSNFETPGEKLMQIVLSGQPQLARKLASPDLVQLRQRISIFAHLQPLSLEDTTLYVAHRLRVAGYNSDTPLFTAGALRLIAGQSEGIPRNINNLCFNALSLGCALKRKTIDCDIVREVVADLDLERWWNESSLAARPEEKGAQEVRAFASAASAPSMLAGLLPKLALAMAVLLALTGALFESHRWAAPNIGVEANSAGPALVPAARSSFSADQGPRPVTPASTIRVARGRTLLGICVEKFGRCNPELLQEIHRLNPRLRNLDHIKSGQRIRIPVSGAIQGNTDRPGRASLVERGTQ